MKLHLALAPLATALFIAGCATSPTPGFKYMPPEQPEAASGYIDKPGWATKKFAVAAANPLATDAGYQILKAGGSAVDAAIAVQMAARQRPPRPTKSSS
jgi:gamma-glutamyltranspeptidase/glutathione hydrolase